MSRTMRDPFGERSVTVTINARFSNPYKFLALESKAAAFVNEFQSLDAGLGLYVTQLEHHDGCLVIDMTKITAISVTVAQEAKREFLALVA